MRWLPGVKRAVSLEEIIFIGLIAAILAPFVTAVFSGTKSPSLSEIIFGSLPFFFFIITFTIAVLMNFFKEKQNITGSLVFSLVLFALCFSSVASIFRIWNDGSYFTVLTPSQIMQSLLTFGFLPFKNGPIVYIRFLPLIFGLGAGYFLYKSGVKRIRCILASLTIYTFSSLINLFMSLMAGVISWLSHLKLENSDDVFRLLVKQNAIGYWSQMQLERFLMPVGRQAENIIMAVHGAVVFLALSGVLFFIFMKAINAAGDLAKRIVSHDSILWFMPVFIGFTLAKTQNYLKVSYSEIISFVILLIILVAWIGWWRFKRDQENITRDEFEYPGRPLPSGLIQPHKLERVYVVLLSVALFGAGLLGWSVFIGVFAATLIVYLFSRTGAAWRDGVITNVLGTFLVAVSLAWSGAIVGLKDAAVPFWIVRIFLSAGLLVGLSRLFKDLQDILETRKMILVVFCIGLFISVLVSGQKIFWIPTITTIGLLIILNRKLDKCHGYGIYTVEFILVSMAFFAIFIPSSIRHM